ncbi:DUF6895 family protein [Streptomyces syringium]|uniref:DUF6895 family protein n=1 Tax=Streptomyces syringium TaxID=76729 RepID=UPI003AAAF9D0
MSSVTATAHQVASKALAWLHAHHERGALPPGAASPDLADPDSQYKPLGEHALAGSLVLREAVSGTAEQRMARELVDFAWGQFRGGDLLYERTLRHTLITDALELYGSFARAGHRHGAFEQLLRHTTALASLRAAEMLPNRRLAVANAARLVGVDDGADWSALIRRTWLGGCPEPWAIDWMTAYHVTHAVFHITDWGARPGDLPPDIGRYLADWLPVWADIWAEAEQWDLFCELLIVGACLEEPWCDPGAWAALAAVQHDDGLVPRDGEPVDDDPGQRFLDHQHPAIVAAVAGCLTVSRTLDGTRARTA